MEPLAIRLHNNDNVVTAKSDINSNIKIEEENISSNQHIPVGHKIATRDISRNEEIIKYDNIIGIAKEDIKKGDHVHVHNTGMVDKKRDYEFSQGCKDIKVLPEEERATFMGYKRPNGKVGTRNFIGIISSVNCSATVCKKIAEAYNEEALSDYENVDGIVSITHGTGCGINSNGLGWELLQATISGYSRHPNFGGLIIIGLGCEVNQVSGMAQSMSWANSDTFKMMTIQDVGGTRKTIQEGVEIIKQMLPILNKNKRVNCPASELILGLECGGSDAYSGMTANPALGAAVDLLVKNGGTGTLAETPEIFGAEHLLTRRAVNEKVGQKIVNFIKWWQEDYLIKFEENKEQLHQDPSPGNKAGGLTTILEKSLGAVAKGGTTNLIDVYQFAESIKAKGFTFMNTPGYDVTSVTGLIAGGANMICFTTGRGSVFGCKPTPSIKLATNDELYNRMTEDMDVNCGKILLGQSTIEEMGQEIFQLILDVASGKQSKSEINGLGDLEFVPWQMGAIT
jgi:altronate hydrolase